MNKSEIICKLYEIEAIKLGSFTLKSGVTSPIYIDMRQIIGYPKLLQAISEIIWEQVKQLSFDLLCGVPYNALPIATCLSLQHDKPMLIVRKEAKAYGTKKMVEGCYQHNQTCLIMFVPVFNFFFNFPTKPFTTQNTFSPCFLYLRSFYFLTIALNIIPGIKNYCNGSLILI